MISLLLLTLCCTQQFLAQSDSRDFQQLAAHYDYSRQAGLDFTEFGVEKRGKIMVIDLQYVGISDEDHVPAYLVVPPGDGPFPAILWGHWMMDGSPMRNRSEFLDEAVVLARSGVMSLLIDTPMVRPGYAQKSQEDDPLGWAEQFSETERQQIVDLRRGLDLLLTRRGIDRQHIGYVGHSYNAHAGAILAGVEKRISAFVLMAGTYSDEQDVRDAKDGNIYKWKQKVGEEKLERYLEAYAWDDPANFLAHTNGQSIFLQFATGDHISPQQAQKYLDAFSAKDKKMQIYEAGHALNAAARLDRDKWLQQRLKFKKVDDAALNAIPQLK